MVKLLPFCAALKSARVNCVVGVVCHATACSRARSYTTGKARFGVSPSSSTVVSMSATPSTKLAQAAVGIEHTRGVLKLMLYMAGSARRTRACASRALGLLRHFPTDHGFSGALARIGEPAWLANGQQRRAPIGVARAPAPALQMGAWAVRPPRVDQRAARRSISTPSMHSLTAIPVEYRMACAQHKGGQPKEGRRFCRAG